MERGRTTPWRQTSEGWVDRRDVGRPNVRFPHLTGVEDLGEGKEQSDRFAGGAQLAGSGLQLHGHGGVSEERQVVAIVHMQRLGAGAILHRTDPGTVDS